MQTVSDTLSYFQKRCKKITTIRKLLVDFFLSEHAVLSVPQIQKKLTRQGLKAHKTSIYREIAFLLEQKIIKVVAAQSTITLYESALSSHHHHVVCCNCGEADKVDVQDLEEKLRVVEQQIIATGFLVSDHSLEFYGTCKECI